MTNLPRAACVSAFVALVLGLSTTGGASPRTGERVVLRSTSSPEESGGSAVVMTRAGHRVELIRLRVRGLQGSSEYLVRDRLGGGVLGSFRTGPSGAGRARMAKSAPDGFSGMMLEIVEPIEGAVVLESEEPVPDMHADGACAPPDGAGHDGHDAAHHGTGDHGSGGDMHGGGSMHGDGGHM